MQSVPRPPTPTLRTRASRVFRALRLLPFLLLALPLYQNRALPRLRARSNPCTPTAPPPATLPLSPAAIPSLAAYLRAHHATYRCLENAACLTPPQNVLIWRCPSPDPLSCAGLGDRFRGILFSFLLAIATNRTFLLDWPAAPYPLHSALHPRHLNWFPPSELLASMRERPPPHLPWFLCQPPRECTEGGHMPHTAHLPMPVPAGGEDKGGEVDLARADLPTVLAEFPVLTIATRLKLSALPLFLSNPHVTPRMPRMPATDSPLFARSLLRLQRELFRVLFRPAPDLASQLEAKVFGAGVPYVGIHARTGVDVGETRDPRFQYLAEKENRTAKLLLRCARKVGAGGRVYVASDSQRLKQQVREMGGGMGVEVRCLEDRALHFGIRSGVREAKGTEGCDRFLSVFVDLMALAGGEGMVITGSGFANAAFLMGNVGALAVARVGEQVGECEVVDGGKSMLLY
eukprot:GFKZ01015205.1.p1 GENE.GFKZ01015205.1~~GFKZ01015205.1.p1  ORF type:complete len:513 (-),score=23.86 GFKZ01015205.1:116-1495(-)